MTVFSKGTWTIFELNTPELNLTNNIKTSWKLMPFMAKSIALNSKSEAIGITPFQYPRLGDVDELQAIVGGKVIDLSPDELIETISGLAWTYDPLTNIITSGADSVNLTDNKLWYNDPEQWKIADGVYAFWLASFEWSDVHDLSSKKEALAYEYGSPFKFQPAEIKGTITEEAEKLDTIVRKQFQVIVDFNLNRAWINTSNKNMIGCFINLMSDLNIPVVDFRPESQYGMEPQWTETFLKKLYETSEYKDGVSCQSRRD